MTDNTFADSIDIGVNPDTLYDLVSDVTRMGDWSPECRACWWEEDQELRVGDWFGGRNERDGHVWETRSQVTTADRGREFEFRVGGSYVQWNFSFSPIDGGTKLTESWEFLPDGLAFFEEKYGEQAAEQMQLRRDSARNGIPVTLAAIKRTAETG